MSFKAKDGKMFPTGGQAQKYDRWLDEQRTMADRGKDDVENAPGGAQHLQDIREHGIVHEAHIKAEGNGRWRLTTTHADGQTATSVHPQWFRAHELAGKYFDPDGKPPALETHQKARAHPVGPKEGERIASEDGRVDEKYDDEN